MKWLINASAAIAAVFAPIKMALLIVLVLVIADLITGVIAAMKRKEKIMSSGFRRTIIKLFLYEIAILFAFLAETYLTGAEIPVCKIVSAFIGLTEVKSLIENCNEISGNSLFKSLVDKLGSFSIDKLK